MDVSYQELYCCRTLRSNQVVLNWHFQLGIATNPMATNPLYQRDDLDYFGFELDAAEILALNHWAP